jgi:hypothetical protein
MGSIVKRERAKKTTNLNNLPMQIARGQKNKSLDFCVFL